MKLTDKILDEKKRIYKSQFIVRELPNGKVFFIDKKTHKLDCSLTYQEYPDKYYDNYLHKVVDWSNSAYVRIIQERKLKRFYIPITKWSKRCETGRCCKTRTIAVPIKHKDKLLLYSAKDVLYNMSEFELMYECKMFTKKGKYLKTEITKVDLTLKPTMRDAKIKELFSLGIPAKALSHIWRLRENRVYQIVKSINPKAFKKSKNNIKANNTYTL